MAGKLPFGNFSHDLGGTLFSRCFWYRIISVLTQVFCREQFPLKQALLLAQLLAFLHCFSTEGQGTGNGPVTLPSTDGEKDRTNAQHGQSFQ